MTELSIPLFDGFSLQIADGPGRSPDHAIGPSEYPTARLQKGLVLLHNGRELAGEGVGFGVPILKRGLQTIFPGGMDLTWRRHGAVWEVHAVFAMNLVERLARPGRGSVRSGALYSAKDILAVLHRRCPPLRRLLTAVSVSLRRTFGWVTTFEAAALCATVAVTYTIAGADGSIGVELELSDIAAGSITEVVLMNELSAHHFDRYADADGADLRGSAIGSWDEVAAAEASFASTAEEVEFSLAQVEGARLYRGRELIGSRLAWSGFGYSFPATRERFACTLNVARA